MLTQNTIDQVKEVQLSKVVGYYLPDLKKKGVNHQACCPFHGEKTPSFVVSDVKGIYKCFGCGVSGSAISFVMTHKHLQFIDACKAIAEICGITIEYEKREYSEQEKANYSAAQLQEQVLNLVIPMMQKALHNLPESHPAKLWLAERHMNNERILDWQLGWCPEDWRFLTPMLIERKLYEPAKKLGIIKTSDNNHHYDGYRSRIVFPITDAHGKFIGLGGRYIKVNPNDAADIPKYINPSDCELYNKSTVLYGLSRAAKAIRDEKKVYVVEGYMDVITPHLVGLENTVATCGTAFTDRQMKLLKRYTDHVVVWRDNDNAGEASFRKAVPDLLRHDFKVSKAQYSKDFKDPDAYCQQLFAPNDSNITCYDPPKAIDAVNHLACEMWENAHDDIVSQAQAKADILNLISNISNEFIRTNYRDTFTKFFKWKASDTKKQFDTILESAPAYYDDEDEDESSGIKWASWVSDEQKEEVMRKGYLACNKKDEKGRPMVGYYTFGQNGKTEITNFVVTPIFRIENASEAHYLAEIDNGYNPAVVHISSKLFASPEQFQGECLQAGGAYMIFGSKLQWQRIAVDLLLRFPVSIQINNLGWVKRGGFFAFVDRLYTANQPIVMLDKWGVAKVNDKHYFVAASSEAYKKMKDSDNDVYQNIRFLTYKESPINFQTWANQMYRVYGQKGIVGIAYAILSLFKDVVFEVDNNCPHLYAFGEPSSGKSKWAESITAIFYYRRAAMNLNSGTDNAFFAYMGVFSNCPAHLNEFDSEVIKDEWFQALKGAYDGEGRERGRIGAKNSTEIQKVNSTLILTGQKLVTKDDNSVVTRSIIEGFSAVRDDERKADDIAEYVKLKDWEKDGMNSMLLEVLAHRNEFEANYKTNFNKQISYWRKNNTTKQELNIRILQNFCHLFTCYRMIDNVIKMPQEARDFSQYCFDQAVKWSSFLSTTDTLSEFWRTLQFLSENGSIIDGWDFIVQEETKVKIREGKVEKDKDLLKATKVLYLRLNNVHKLFQTAFRNRTGREAMSLDSLLHYMASRKYYLGPIKQKQFKRIITKNDVVKKQEGTNMVDKIETNKTVETRIASCYAFNYDELELDLVSEVNEISELPFP